MAGSREGYYEETVTLLLAAGTRTSGFPTGANFPPGKYYIRAQSFDHAGHASSPLYISFYKQ